MTPYSKRHEEASPSGLTVPPTVAVLRASAEAGAVVSTGGSCANVAVTTVSALSAIWHGPTPDATTTRPADETRMFRRRGSKRHCFAFRETSRASRTDKRYPTGSEATEPNDVPTRLTVSASRLPPGAKTSTRPAPRSTTYTSLFEPLKPLAAMPRASVTSPPPPNEDSNNIPFTVIRDNITVTRSRKRVETRDIHIFSRRVNSNTNSRRRPGQPKVLGVGRNG